MTYRSVSRQRKNRSVPHRRKNRSGTRRKNRSVPRQRKHRSVPRRRKNRSVPRQRKNRSKSITSQGRTSGKPLKVLKKKEYYTKDWAKKHPKYLIVFGENDQEKNSGKKQYNTQAIVREFPNAIGLRTCYRPGEGFRDDRLNENKKMIDADIKEILDRWGTGDYTQIIIPADGLGTGVAQLPQKAKRTYKYLQKALSKHGLN